MSDELEPDQVARLRAALRARADRAPARAPGAATVRRLSALRRRRRAAIALGAASTAVLVGLAVANSQRDPSPVAAEAGRGPKATTTVPASTTGDTTADTAPALDAIPLPTIGAYPRDPAMGPQPTRVEYVVREGDTFDTIAAAVGITAAEVKTQSGGTIVPGQTLSLLVGPTVSVPPPAAGGVLAP